MDVDAKVNLNKFYDQARGDIREMVEGMGVGAAVIFNDTPSTVTFFVYNYIDTVYVAPAQKTTVAAQAAGSVVASGTFFKIHPNGNKSEEYPVEPGRAYVYHGVGNMETV